MAGGRRRRGSRRRAGVPLAPRPAAPVPDAPPAPGLPIAAHAADIASLIENHPVVVVAGETGSGKSTQLPRICLPRCRQFDGMIAHTQPRRIAAREIAARVSAELGTRLGSLVGYKVRFGERTGRDTRIKVLTDGMLLAEMEGDRDLRAYHTIIVDEAHERSINIDFLLGYLKRLVRRRRDLRVVVTSATIDTERFARHFDDCPVVSVSGRVYPVEVLYRPRGEDDNDDSLLSAVYKGIAEVWRRGPGDVLVFLPGEREIREAADYLRRRLPGDAQLLPLFARLSPADQKRIFSASNGRRVVLSTNVAETSLTVPGVRYVVDSGLARVSRYSAAAKVQRLPVEKISRAAADQRKGRCGRVSNGVCVRLYAQEDYDARAPFTDPEIVRTSLAQVVLRMKALGLGPIDRFPFLDPPDARQVRSAIRLLNELGALDDDERLTRVGRELASLPVEARIGRLLLEGAKRNCLAEVLVLASYLSVPEPRVTPGEQLEKARRHHATFPEADSDIEAAISLFRDYCLERAAASRRGLDRWCQENFLAPFRMREWADLHEQLGALMAENGHLPGDGRSSLESIAIAFLSAFLSHVAAVDDKGQWRGANNRIVAIHPSSRSFRKRPKWFVAAELVETGRLYARRVLPVTAAWIERAAGPRIRVTYSEPWWDEKSGNVMAYQSGTLFGLTVYAGRRSRLPDAAAAREIFINEALCTAAMGDRFAFARHNRDLLEEVAEARRKLRIPVAAPDDLGLAARFDAMVPEEVSSRATLARWLNEEPGADESLRLRREDVIEPSAVEHERDYPVAVTAGATPLAVNYRYDPGVDADGVNIRVPLPLVNQFDPDECARQIPGWFAEHVEGLLRTLPKSKRRALQPLSRSAATMAEMIATTKGSLVEALAAALAQRFGVRADAVEFDAGRLPPHLRLRFELVDGDRRVIDADRDFEALRSRHADAARDAFSDASAEGYPRRFLVSWDFGDLPDSVPVAGYGTRVRAFPALLERPDRVDLVLVDDPDRARSIHRHGVMRLVRLVRRRFFKDLLVAPAVKRAVLQYAGLFPGADLAGPLCNAVIESALGFYSDPPRRQAAFRDRLDAGGERMKREGVRIGALVEKSVSMAFNVRRELDGIDDAAFGARIEARLQSLVGPGFPFAEPVDWLEHLPRFVQALSSRVEKYRHNPASEADNLARVDPFVARLGQGGSAAGAALDDYRFLLEEYHVSLFAQHLKTSVPVSPKRLESAWTRIGEQSTTPAASRAAAPRAGR